MHVHFLLFALYRDLTGTEELRLEVPAGASAADAVRALRAQGGGFARIPAEPAVAVNREYVALDTVLNPGDEVAILPPVAGG